MNTRGSEWGERASALLLLAACVVAAWWARLDLDAAAVALDARELNVLQLETAARRTGHDARAQVALDVAACLTAAAPRAVAGAPR